MGDMPTAYCVCEIPLKARSRVQTPPMPGTSSPEWRHTQTVKDFAAGDALVFDVYSTEGPARPAQGGRRLADELLGRAFLPGEQFYPNGIEGDFPIDGLENATLTLRIVNSLLSGTRKDSAKKCRRLPLPRQSLNLTQAWTARCP